MKCKVASGYSAVMAQIETLITTVPVDKLRADVMLGESQVGTTFGALRLPSGRTIEQHTKRARLFLDLIDSLAAQEAEEKGGAK